jgi:O-6-methylguanine DNA methyltransferase
MTLLFQSSDNDLHVKWSGTVLKGKLVSCLLTLSSQPFSAHLEGDESLKTLLPVFKQWFVDYYNKKNSDISLPFLIEKPEFTSKVLKELLAIPFGKVASYKDIAQRVRQPKAYRGVGQACHRNPFPLVIPCHRVVSHNGSLGGFALPLVLKTQLLKFEKAI